MKLLTGTAPYQAKIRISLSERMKKARKYLIMFLVANLISYIILPSIFFGFWNVVGGITGNIAESRKIYHIRRKYGRTVADVYLSGKTWSKAIQGINPLNWHK